MRKSVKKILAFSLAATMIMQPLPSNFTSLTTAKVSATEDVEHHTVTL